MTSQKRMAVIGGGIAGLGAAWQLARRGWEVQLFERHQIGSGASGKAAGMLAPTSEVSFEEQQLLAFGRHSLSLYPQWLEELTGDAGDPLALDYRSQGALIVAIDRDDAQALERLHQYHLELGLDVERLMGRRAREREPGLSPNIHYALFSSHDHQIDPVAMVDAMGRAFLNAGGVLHENRPVEALRIGDRAIEALTLSDGTEVPVSTVLLAAGAWTPQIAGIPDDLLPHTRPVRGQMLVVESGDPPLVEHVIRAPDAYLVPRSDGRLLIGSTMEERGFDERLTAGGILDILTGAWEAVPGIYDAPLLDSWTGFRPVTLANEPRIGPTDVEGLYVSVGHGRNGILFTPATAYGLAEAIDAHRIPKALEPFQL